MNKLLIILAILIPISIYSQESLTLEECYEMATNNYPEIEKYSLIEKSREYNISNASKSWLPQITISAKATYQSDVTSIPLDGLESLIAGFEIPSLSKDQYSLGAEISQTVWDGGRIKSKKEAAQASSQIEMSGVEVNLYAIEQRVNQIYFGVLLQEELLKQSKLLVDDLGNNLRMVESLINNGVATLSDKQLLEVEILQVQQQIVAIESFITSYRRVMGYMIGKNISNDVKFVVPQMILDYSYTSIIRPELNYFDAQQKLLMSQENSIESDIMPNINLFVSSGYGRPGLNMLENSFKPYAIGGIRAAWNISNMYRRKNSLNLLANQKQTIEIEREKFLYNIELSKIEQNEAIAKINRLMQHDKEICALRESIQHATEAKVKNGTASTTDLINDISAKNRAERQLSIRKIELLSHIYSLKHTLNSEN